MLKSFGIMVTALASGASGAAFLATSQDHLSAQPQADGPQIRVEQAALLASPAPAVTPIRLVAPQAERAAPHLSVSAPTMPSAPFLVANLPATEAMPLVPQRVTRAIPENEHRVANLDFGAEAFDLLRSPRPQPRPRGKTFLALAQQTPAPSLHRAPPRYTAAERAQWPRPVPAPWRGGPIAQEGATGYVSPFIASDMIPPEPAFDATEVTAPPAVRRIPLNQPDFNPWRTGVFR